MACPGSGDEDVAEGHTWETSLKFPSPVTRGSLLSSLLGALWKPILRLTLIRGAEPVDAGNPCQWKSYALFVSDRKPRRVSISEELGFPQCVFMGVVFDDFASYLGPF